MFTQECLIRSNTPALRSKLKDLGYRIYDSDGASFIVTGLGLYEDWEDDCVMSSNRTEIITELVLSGTIDCGTNEEMFLALAALRDDSDINQWFIFKDSECDIWMLCNEDDIEEFIYHQFLIYRYFHKATPREIVEHFTRKEK